MAVRPVARPSVALLLIDVQKAFTEGSWRAGISDSEVLPLKQAFEECARLLSRLDLKKLPIRMTRTPFRGRDFELDDSVSEAVRGEQIAFFIKLSTSAMHSEGFPGWIQELLDSEIKTLVIGGCTITSCVRVSSCLTQKSFQNSGLRVVVDLSLCGARKENYKKRCPECLARYLDQRNLYNNSYLSDCNMCKVPGVEMISPVDLAVQGMRKAGVNVVEKFNWPQDLES
ncbi:uncharacterized protein LOC116603661 [Nematostella vectensis]|uniref:uncharacterized protein LOC116603661 n=1 Tax=Nematostella vectensis TaxID=45351 RepID=UPI002076E30F|nr:uncharacterized protein LOC116603661 [Nematostella vectensis]